jgi:hypothetical protein
MKRRNKSYDGGFSSRQMIDQLVKTLTTEREKLEKVKIQERLTLDNEDYKNIKNLFKNRLEAEKAKAIASISLQNALMNVDDEVKTYAEHIAKLEKTIKINELKERERMKNDRIEKLDDNISVTKSIMNEENDYLRSLKVKTDVFGEPNNRDLYIMKDQMEKYDKARIASNKAIEIKNSLLSFIKLYALTFEDINKMLIARNEVFGEINKVKEFIKKNNMLPPDTTTKLESLKKSFETVNNVAIDTTNKLMYSIRDMETYDFIDEYSEIYVFYNEDKIKLKEIYKEHSQFNKEINLKDAQNWLKNVEEWIIDLRIYSDEKVKSIEKIYK